VQAEQLKPLTSLRFFAAMWVVFFSYWKALGAGFTPALAAKGYLGVEVFFILSGFILCHVYLPSVESGRYRYGGFLWARLARVYPLHLAVLIGVGLMAGAALALGLHVDDTVLAWQALPANLLMVHAWGFAHVSGWNHPSWSISAEWFAYLSFPAFAWLAIKARSRPWVAVAAAVAFLFILYSVFQALAGFSLTEATIAWGALRIVPCFALGCALYLLWRSGAVQGRTKAVAGALGSLAILLCSVALGAPDAFVVAAGGGLILFLAALGRSGETWMGHPVLVYLGEISYSIYMVCVPWQLLFVNGVQRILHVDKGSMPVWTWSLFIVGVVPLAALSHHLIERPAREWLKTRGASLALRGPRSTPA
jgi:peptidoglycan/LPS O-acetylase OafA/YrhL